MLERKIDELEKNDDGELTGEVAHELTTPVLAKSLYQLDSQTLRLIRPPLHRTRRERRQQQLAKRSVLRRILFERHRARRVAHSDEHALRGKALVVCENSRNILATRDDPVSAVARCPDERRFTVKNRPRKEGIGARWAWTPEVHVHDLRGVDVCRYRGDCRSLHFDLPFADKL